MLPPQFVYLAIALSAFGAYGYIRDTLRGETSPNRVTWSLWGIEGVLGFGVEIQQHVGLASWMTLMLGLVPCAIVFTSFKNPHAAWRIGAFDLVCGGIALAGLIFWAFVHEPTVALVSFVSADQVAALPTLRKSWLAPSTETSRVFVMGCINCVITLFTLTAFTTAGVLYPGCVAVADFVMATLIISRAGPRLRGENSAVSPA